jgi:hypothetical protein
MDSAADNNAKTNRRTNTTPIIIIIKKVQGDPDEYSTKNHYDGDPPWVGSYAKKRPRSGPEETWPSFQLASHQSSDDYRVETNPATGQSLFGY